MQHGGKSLLRASIILTTITTLSFGYLSSHVVSADDSVVSNVSLSVPVSCNMTSTVDTPHTATINPGTYRQNIGTTTFNVLCNDPNGFAIYAIGYTDNVYGNNKLTATINGAIDHTYDISTSTATSGATSSWAMKLLKDGTPNNITIDNSYDNYNVIPTEYTKVASFTPTTTELVSQGTIKSTYASYMSSTQHTGTYDGKVKYTLVHPSSELPPTYPVTTEPGKISYNPNAPGVVDSMSDQSTDDAGAALTTGADVILWPSNFKRSGYGFAGWNTEHDYSGTTYGPMETITTPDLSTTGLSLYAVWVKSAGDLQGWQGCASLASGAVTALTDTRDNNTYAVAKLADGNCWMIENLRLGGSSAMNLTTANTGSTFTLPASTNSFNAGSSYLTTIQMSAKNTLEAPTNMATPINTEVYSYGNYYSWPAAIGSTTAYFAIDQSATTSICPSGWHLPKGGDNQNTANNEFLGLSVALTGAQPANYSSETYPSYTGDPEGINASNLHRKYPNNFLYSGYLAGQSLSARGSNGNYWSSVARGSNYSYSLVSTSSRVLPGTGTNGKYLGFSVRCVADESASPGKIMYHDNGAESPTKMDEQDPGNVTSVDLWPSNFQRSGYGFAGWNTKADGTGTKYGPMETITLPYNFATNGLNLYAMWIPSAGNIQGWTGCPSLATGAVTALTDTRDNNTYAVAKLADGKCWMIENLRLGGSSAMNLTTSNTVTAFTLPASTNTFTTSNYTTIEMSAKNTLEAPTNMTTADAEVYSYGNYYSWPAAIGSTTAYSTNNQSVSTSICPSGWHLPKGGDSNNATNSEFWKLGTAIMNGTTPNVPNIKYSYYDNNVTNTAGKTATAAIRSYPNNFLYSGLLYGSSFGDRGSAGLYWPSTVYYSNSSYQLFFYSSAVSPGTNFYSKYYGFSVRCVAGS